MILSAIDLFLFQCSRYVEDEFPQPRGAKKSNTAKYLLGGGVLAFVIAIIWFPLVFFAFGNTVSDLIFKIWCTIDGNSSRFYGFFFGFF